MTEPIYRLWNFGFGDHWASMSLYRHYARATGERPVVSHMQHGVDFLPRLREIDRALAWDGEGLQDWTPMFTNEQPNTDLDGFDVWACPVVPTRERWFFAPKHHGIVVYQFDGVSSPDKNPSPVDAKAILDHIIKLGFMPVELGKNLTVDQCVRLCATAALFVGSCSGMSHLAHSVGVPVYLLEYGLPVITAHRQKQFVICKGAEHFIGESRAYLALIKKLRGTQ